MKSLSLLDDTIDSFIAIPYRSMGRTGSTDARAEQLNSMLNKIGVLIVDDEKTDACTIKRALEDSQFTVLVASDYDQAVRIFEQAPKDFDLAIVDVALPGKNGVELAKRLLTIKPDLRILFVSGQVGISVIRFYGIDAPDEHFLQKPFDSTTLLRRIHEALNSNYPLRLQDSAGGGTAS